MRAHIAENVAYQRQILSLLTLSSLVLGDGTVGSGAAAFPCETESHHCRACPSTDSDKRRAHAHAQLMIKSATTGKASRGSDTSSLQ